MGRFIDVMDAMLFSYQTVNGVTRIFRDGHSIGVAAWDKRRTRTWPRGAYLGICRGISFSAPSLPALAHMMAEFMPY